MGLESVEMVIAVEDRFGVTIPDEAAEKIETVGSLYEFLLSVLKSTPGDRCKSQHVFYRIRRWLPQHHK
ncbi:MAG: phosphopantetheine-binding protein, partial [Bacteroidota bacterium]